MEFGTLHQLNGIVAVCPPSTSERKFAGANEKDSPRFIRLNVLFTMDLNRRDLRPEFTVSPLPVFFPPLQLGEQPVPPNAGRRRPKVIWHVVRSRQPAVPNVLRKKLAAGNRIIF